MAAGRTGAGMGCAISTFWRTAFLGREMDRKIAKKHSRSVIISA
jgi:hypothetical protein